MKKVLGTVLFLSLAFTGSAKKVKFAVDMDTNLINITGMHVGGDFQTAAGYTGGDWASGTTPLMQEGSTGIYSIIVDIPAFAKYEYKFINGNQWYEAEFVPFESRVDPLSDDNRWIYVDSLGNDTTFVGAIIFSANAPRGLTLMRFFVDMSNAGSVDPAGVHVAGSFQNWDPTLVRLYSFGSNIYQIIAYDTVTTNQYKFYNGNSVSVTENVPSPCAVSGNRELVLPKDTVLDVVCFSGCSACVLNSIAQNSETKITLYPNPAKEFTRLDLDDETFDISVCDLTGKTITNYAAATGSLIISSKELTAGMYFITAFNKVRAKTYTFKLVVE